MKTRIQCINLCTICFWVICKYIGILFQKKVLPESLLCWITFCMTKSMYVHVWSSFWMHESFFLHTLSLCARLIQCFVQYKSIHDVKNLFCIYRWIGQSRRAVEIIIDFSAKETIVCLNSKDENLKSAIAGHKLLYILYIDIIDYNWFSIIFCSISFYRRILQWNNSTWEKGIYYVLHDVEPLSTFVISLTTCESSWKILRKKVHITFFTAYRTIFDASI